MFRFFCSEWSPRLIGMNKDATRAALSASATSYIPSGALNLYRRGKPSLPSTCTPRRSSSIISRTEMSTAPNSVRYSIAPMMEVTDRHFRALSRLISKNAVLYTEMVVDRTLIYNEKLRDYALRIPPLPCSPFEQHPVVLQLGGSVPEELEAAARIAATYGYSEVNLNCGCPSPKVAGKGCFGAALMRSPGVVAEATRRMAAVLPDTTPVTVKCRLGVDDDDSYEGLRDFIATVHKDGGVNHFIVHARKAILGGLSPAQNRSIPPLKYHFVHRLLKDFPKLSFTINGGFTTLPAIEEQLQIGVHGVMVGRAVMDKPWHALCDVDHTIFAASKLKGEGAFTTRRAVLRDYATYAEKEMEVTGCSLRAVIKPLLNLFHGEPNGKKYRRVIDECLRDPGIKVKDVIERACTVLTDTVLDAPPPSIAEAMNKESDSNTSAGASHEKAQDAQSDLPCHLHGGYAAVPVRNEVMVSMQDMQ